MKYYFHPLAEQELNHAIAYYEDKQSGLGIDFSKEVIAAIQKIITFPDAWTQIDGKTRRCITNKFPFGILYTRPLKSNILTAMDAKIAKVKCV